MVGQIVSILGQTNNECYYLVKEVLFGLVLMKNEFWMVKDLEKDLLHQVNYFYKEVLVKI